MRRLAPALLRYCVLGGFAFCFAGLAQASETFVVQVPAVYSPTASVVRPVREQCAIEGLIGNNVFERVSDRYPGSTPLDAAPQDPASKYLKLTILDVFGVGGGGWSGPKSITIRADLIQSGRILGSAVLKRTSVNGGILGPFKGTCGFMERIAEALGKDVAARLPLLGPALAPDTNFPGTVESPTPPMAPEQPATPPETPPA